MLRIEDFDSDAQLLFRYLGGPGVSYEELAFRLGISKQAVHKKLMKATRRYGLHKGDSAAPTKRDIDGRLRELNGKLRAQNDLVKHLQRLLVVSSTNQMFLTCFNEKLKALVPRWTGPRLSHVQKMQILTNCSKYLALGGTLKEFCKATHRTPETIARWKRSFEIHGINGLVDKSTRPKHFRKLVNANRDGAEATAQRLIEIAHAQPRSYGVNRSNWTQQTLARAFETEFGKPIGVNTVSRLLRKRGYTVKKVRRVLTSPDPEYRIKVELLLQTLRGLQTDQLLFFIDELGPLRIRKYGGRILVHRADRPTFPQIQPQKGSITMSAALSATTNQVTWLYTSAKNTRAMIELIEILFNQHYAMRTIYITWDAASWHSSGSLLQWLDDFNQETVRSRAGPLIHLVPLPTSSQFLDVLEAVFSGMKRAVIHHSDYQSKSAMKAAISTHFIERNVHFIDNPRKAGKKIWEIDFFDNPDNLKAGDYREW